ncbi:MAG: hypothetical protein KAR14_10105, partial [Candidatus Aminicenantes bacterium]|nr:hypothetical protein [Candidatus Aminicenantes bacterium]
KGSEYIDENRVKVENPEFSINSIFPYFRKYEAYYNDNFSFRSFLISWYNVLKYNLSGTSPLDSVYIGKEGWLFLAKESGITLDKYYFSFDLFKSSDMKLWKERILQRKNWAESLGCTYLLIVIPNKQTIYPKMMPSGMNTALSKSMMDQLFEYLHPELDNIVIDLRNKFRKEKEEHRLYQKTDTHWNQLGAYSAYRSILNYLSVISGENIEPDDISEFRIELREKDGGDLARLLSFHKSKYRDRIITLEREEDNNIESSEINPDFADSSVLVNKNKNGQFPPLLFIYDSFGEYLNRYLSSQFIESYLIQNRDLNIYSDLIKKKGIKYIVEEIAERHFLQKPPEALSYGR